MPRCQYPKCERVVRDPNKFSLCHVHLEMAEFFLWFSETLQRMEQMSRSAQKPGQSAMRPSGLVVPGR